MESAPNATPILADTGPKGALLGAFASALSGQNILEFLERHLSCASTREEFCAWLHRQFPRTQNLNYALCFADLFPGIDESQISSQPAKLLHASALGFTLSPKLPLNDTCLQLAEHIVTSGFLSGSEPGLDNACRDWWRSPSDCR